MSHLNFPLFVDIQKCAYDVMELDPRVVGLKLDTPNLIIHLFGSYMKVCACTELIEMFIIHLFESYVKVCACTELIDLQIFIEFYSIIDIVTAAVKIVLHIS